jgi:hypothetical protein
LTGDGSTRVIPGVKTDETDAVKTDAVKTDAVKTDAVQTL